MLRSFWRPLPAITRVGLVITASGVGLDFVHHVFTQHIHAVSALGIGSIGHVLTLAGMVITLLGVIRAAADSRRRARQKGDSDAARSSASAAR